MEERGKRTDELMRVLVDKLKGDLNEDTIELKKYFH